VISSKIARYDFYQQGRELQYISCNGPPGFSNEMA
jgi:hypothetical protein